MSKSTKPLRLAPITSCDEARADFGRVVLGDTHAAGYVGNAVGTFAFRHRDEEFQLPLTQAVHRRLEHHAVHVVSGENHSLLHIF